MTMPRQIVEGRCYLVTRRCRDRRFFLRPDRRINRIFLYCLAYAAAQTGVLIHAVVVMSNHFHLVVTDVNGNLPKFYHRLSRISASAVNAERSRRGSVYEPGEKTSVVWLASEQAIIDKMAYVIANPVAAGLVSQPQDWPGVVSAARDVLGRTLTVDRPEVYFRKAQPSSLSLSFCAPPCFVDREQWLAEAVQHRVTEITDDVHAELRRTGKRFLGRGAVLGTSWNARPKKESVEHRRPTFAGVIADVLRSCASEERAFRTAYGAAMRVWRAGDREVEFPIGTWWMRTHHNVRTPGACDARRVPKHANAA